MIKNDALRYGKINTYSINELQIEYQTDIRYGLRNDKYKFLFRKYGENRIYRRQNKCYIKVGIPLTYVFCGWNNALLWIVIIVWFVEWFAHNNNSYV